MVQSQKPDAVNEAAAARKKTLDVPDNGHPADSAQSALSALQSEAETLRRPTLLAQNDSKITAKLDARREIDSPFDELLKLQSARRPVELQKPELPLPFSPPTTGLLGNWEAQHAERVARAGAGVPDTAFYGDSITDGMQLNNEFYKFNGTTQNFGIHSDNTQNLRYRLENGEMDFKDGKAPKNFVLLIGTNDIGTGKTHEQIARDVIGDADLISKKFPNSKVLVLGLLPRAGLRGEVTDINNILQNDVIKKHSNNLRFADVGGSMLDRTGAQAAGLWQPDGTHPTYDLGYSRLLPAIKRVLETN